MLLASEDLQAGCSKYIGTIYIFIVYIFIDSVDAYYESIREKAIILWPLRDMPYVTRACGVKNYEVCHVAFSQQT